MEDRVELLRDRVVAEMERLGFCSETIDRFKCDCSKLINFLWEKGNDLFCEDIGAEYLQVKYGYPNGKLIRSVSASTRRAIWCVRRLGEMKQYGALVALKKKIPNYKWTGSDIELIQRFMNQHYRNQDRCKRTQDSQEGLLKTFYRFLDFRNVSSVLEINAHIISDYVKSLQGYAPISIYTRLRTLKQYFSFLYKQGLCSVDWSTAVPQVKSIQNLRVPALWNKDQIQILLSAIDRESPVGKRDYAILLLATELGIRCCDVAALQLRNLNFSSRDITFIQHKTKKLATLHLPDSVGWAIIDYLRYGRPRVENPHLFLTARPPFREFMSTKSVGSILDRTMQKAGILKKSGLASGMHSLRHALARRMLEQGEALTTVSAVMCHVRASSVTPYLRVDIEGLRGCTLSLPMESPV